MRKPVTLITGANGEIGHGLIEHFGHTGERELVALDLEELDAPLQPLCAASIAGDILDERLLARLVSEYEIHTIFHLAALLSTRSEYTPRTAHRVNVEGTMNLLQLASDQARWHGHTVAFLFPSSIAAYGLPDLETKRKADAVREIDFNVPMTMYGCNKLYCEQVGRYYSDHFRQLAAQRNGGMVDFRSLRFPGLISADTVPSGGTSDYAPDMLHCAARGEPYECFVDEAARIPFMTMPDAIKALVELEAAAPESLTQRVYNVTAFSPTAGEVRDRIVRAFPGAEVTFKPDPPRAAIIDSWPAEVDDSPARRDWGWQPDYNLDRAFDEYLIPSIRAKYQR